MTVTEDSIERQCPECGERLNRDARRCACGWGARKEKNGRVFDHRCTFKTGFERCSYPVGMFPEGSTSGWCIFHRNNSDPALGAEIVRQSRTVPYAEAIRPIVKRNADNPNVREARQKIAAFRGDPQRVAASLPPMREPGADEPEVRADVA